MQRGKKESRGDKVCGRKADGEGCVGRAKGRRARVSMKRRPGENEISGFNESSVKHREIPSMAVRSTMGLK